MKKICTLLFIGISAALSAQRIYLLPTVTAANAHDSLIIEKGDSAFLPHATNKIGMNDVKTYMKTLTVIDTTLINNAKYIMPSGTDVLINLAASNTSDTLYFNQLDSTKATVFNYSSNGNENIVLKGATFKNGTGGSFSTATHPFKLIYDKRLKAWIKIF